MALTFNLENTKQKSLFMCVYYCVSIDTGRLLKNGINISSDAVGTGLTAESELGDVYLCLLFL